MDLSKNNHLEGMNIITQSVIGAAMEVHRTLGPGYLESVYEEAICHEFELRKIAHQRQHPIKLFYKGKNVGHERLDLLVEERVIVELKAVDSLAPIHQAQVISYLRAMNLRLGLLINFNVPILKQGIKRVILD
ncbi:GxxExxY protein [Kamptonema cortianum]|nr:GxxExxY protein [Kamptonema cortianum]